MINLQAEGMGVPAVSVDTAEGLGRDLLRALSERGSHLIEMRLAPLAKWHPGRGSNG